jgi:hypothetical protein
VAKQYYQDNIYNLLASQNISGGCERYIVVMATMFHSDIF